MLGDHAIEIGIVTDEYGNSEEKPVRRKLSAEGEVFVIMLKNIMQGIHKEINDIYNFIDKAAYQTGLPIEFICWVYSKCDKNDAMSLISDIVLNLYSSKSLSYINTMNIPLDPAEWEKVVSSFERINGWKRMEPDMFRDAFTPADVYYKKEEFTYKKEVQNA